jgi:hypothetical protein
MPRLVITEEQPTAQIGGYLIAAPAMVAVSCYRVTVPSSLDG